MIRRKLNRLGTWLLVAEIRMILAIVRAAPPIPLPDFSKLFPSTGLVPEVDEND